MEIAQNPLMIKVTVQRQGEQVREVKYTKGVSERGPCLPRL